MATPEQLVEARKKALKSPRIGKHGKRKKTIAIEKAREEYAKKAMEHYDEILDVQMKEAKKPKNSRERIYVIDQAIGKPIERRKVEAEIEIDLDI